MKKFILKIVDIIIGSFLILTGFMFLLLYVCFYEKADNALISLWMFLFFLCLGFIAIISGVRRIYLTVKKKE
jgi:hypothetical protein